MLGQEIEELLQKKQHAAPMIVCETSLARDIDDLAALALPGLTCAVIDDKHTGPALGQRVFRALGGQHVTLEGVPAADMETVEYIRAGTAKCDALVAVGAGTVSDLCKYASFLDGKPYIAFPTAASMNGYLSANASITQDGTKKTLAAHMPRAVFCDHSIIAAAPPRLSRSGLGDSLARSTAQADWLLSHLLLGTAYDDTPFALIAPLEPELLDNARGIGMSDPGSIALLTRVLLLSGLGMTLAGGSYPASQGEHMIAHAYHMLSADAPATLHGEEIGITTLAMAARQEALLRGTPRMQLLDFPAAEMEAYYGKDAADEAKKAYYAKLELIEAAGIDGLGGRWHAVQERILPVMIPSQRINAALVAAQAPVSIEALGWDAACYRAATDSARFLRDRFTFLDIC